MAVLSMFKPDHLSRYKDIARLLMKHGGRQIADQIGLSEYLDRDHAAGEGARANELASDLESLGPTFIKLGQVLASRADMLPVSYLTALSRLQDEVQPFAYEDVQRIFQEEFGLALEEAFLSFEPEPEAAASLGQVHRARLKNGQPVVVKIQRPGVQGPIEADLEVLYHIARMLDEHSEFGHRYRFLDTVRQFRQNLLRELDYTREADNLRAMGRALADFEHLFIPQPVERFTSRRVLTMDLVEGVKVTEATDEQLQHLDRAALCDELFHAYLKQILSDGFFHADPHPGNVFLMPDGRVALIDLGMVGTLDDTTQEELLNLLVAVAERRGEDAAEVAMTIGERADDFDPKAFRRGLREVLNSHHEQSLTKMQIGRMLMDVCRVAGRTGLIIPAEIMLLGKALLSLDQIGRTLDPEFDPNASIKRHTFEMMNRRARKTMRPGHLFSNLMETRRFLAGLPRRVDRLLDNLADNDLRVKVDAIDEDRLIHGIEKIANRVTVGLVIAALIVGASMLMRVETAFTLFGYPGLAIVLFLSAACFGVIFICRIIWTDIMEYRKRHRR